MTYRRRELSGLAGDALETMPVVVITGLRQSGKTTFLQQDPIFRGRRFYSLDDFAVLEAARRDPDGLVAGEEPITIDEAQRCPELLHCRKARRRPQAAGRTVRFERLGKPDSPECRDRVTGWKSSVLEAHAIYSTGSSRRCSSRKPFTSRNSSRDKTRGAPRAAEPIREREMPHGGMPTIVTGEAKRPHLWFLGYEQTYARARYFAISRSVADLVAFRSLMRLAALRTGQILNQSNLARDVKLPASTVTRYLDLLETSMILEKVEPYLRIGRPISSSRRRSA